MTLIFTVVFPSQGYWVYRIFNNEKDAIEFSKEHTCAVIRPHLVQRDQYVDYQNNIIWILNGPQQGHYIRLQNYYQILRNKQAKLQQEQLEIAELINKQEEQISQFQKTSNFIQAEDLLTNIRKSI